MSILLLILTLVGFNLGGFITVIRTGDTTAFRIGLLTTSMFSLTLILMHAINDMIVW